MAYDVDQIRRAAPAHPCSRCFDTRYFGFFIAYLAGKTGDSLALARQNRGGTRRVAYHIGQREPNPARWAGHLEMILPKAEKLRRGHHEALPYKELPAFMKRLNSHDSMAAMALTFLILTAGRTGEVLGATWDEIDFIANVWTVPPSRMKGNREHRVPLSREASAILERLSQAKIGRYIFFGQAPGKPLSNMALAMLLRRLEAKVTAHGFRSSFRDWAGDETGVQREVAEAALAHIVGDKAEQAYRRGDALEKRRALMDDWGRFCTNELNKF